MKTFCFILLTWTGGFSNGPVYVNVLQVIRIVPETEKTSIHFSGGHAINVLETHQEIFKRINTQCGD